MPSGSVAPAPHVTPKGAAALDAILQSTAESRDLPAVTFGATTAEGPIYFSFAGDRVLGEPDKGPINVDTTLQLYSQTKLVTAIGILQLVDRGLLSLDDPEVINKHTPELAAQPILSYTEDGTEVLTPRKNPLTLRRLLTHTSGLAYDFTSPLIAKWKAAHGLPAFNDAQGGIKSYELPLIAEPGTHWVYSIGIDWAGIILERVSGQTLNEYFGEHIFAPLGIKSLTFHATEENISKLQQVQKRNDDGTFSPSASLRDLTPGVVYKQLSGGGGLLGTAKDYLRLLQGILASKDGGGIISPAAYTELFTNSLPPYGPDNEIYDDLARSKISSLASHQDGSVEHVAKLVGHSVGLALNLADGKFGRKAGSGNWGGAAKTGYWLDPATGIAGIFGTQIITPGNLPEPTWEKVYNKLERTLYDSLEA